jgi:hypothetical protein
MIFVLFQILILSNKKFCVQKGLLKFYAWTRSLYIICI